ncbi:hypothetical protein Tco_0891943 [Tanacetum coccineum]|uniref:Helitron helicase-like domain-containing protein n=1 Tax=Tanacetum coccineum TaxID=301880 RepID=A0ABQ5C7P8_9ASTR
MRQSPTIVGSSYRTMRFRGIGRVCCSVSLKVSANNIRGNMTPCFTAAEDSRHAGTLVSTQRKITRENVQAILVASENAPSKRTRGSIKAVGSRRPHRVTCGSGEHCSNFNASSVTSDRDKCREIDILEFKIRLYNVEGARGYEIPRSSTLRAIVFDSGPTGSTYFDVIIQDKDGSTQSISKLHPSYMSLQLNLLFIYGQSGFHTKLKLRSADSSGKTKREDSSNNTWLVFSALLNKIDSTSSEKIEWRNMLHECSLYKILCNCRIFVLYTVEFQKHGRPHCHTLLWVDSASKIQSPEDVDRFISAKLPDLNVDPHRYKIVLEMMIHGPCGAANLSAPCQKTRYALYGFKDLSMVFIDFLKFNQAEVNETRAERLAKSHDPLALMAHSQTPYNYPVFHQDHPSQITYMQHLPPNNNYNLQPSFNQNYMQQPMPNLEDISNPTTAMYMALVLMVKVGQYVGQIAGNHNRYTAVHNVRNLVVQNAVQNPAARAEANGNGIMKYHKVLPDCLRRGSLCQQLHSACEETKRVNTNCTIENNFQQASASGNQSDNAPIYESDGSAELHE